MHRNFKRVLNFIFAKNIPDCKDNNKLQHNFVIMFLFCGPKLCLPLAGGGRGTDTRQLQLPHHDCEAVTGGGLGPGTLM